MPSITPGYTEETSPNSQTRLAAALFYGVVLLLAYLVYLIFEPFLEPLAWAAVLAVVFYPLHDHLQKRWGKTWAATVDTLFVTAIVVIPAIFVASAFVRQGVEAGRSIQQGLSSGRFERLNDAWLWVQHRFPAENPADLAGMLRGWADRIASMAAARLGDVLRHVATALFDLGVMVFAMFYFFRDGEMVMQRLRAVLPFETFYRERMIREAHDLIFASVTSSLVAALVHALIGGITFHIAGIQSPLFWGVMMGFASLLPIVGSSIIWGPAAIWLIATSHVGRGIFVIAVCAGLVGLVDNVIRPWLISGRAQLGGLLIFISVLGGIAVFGILGVVLGPIIVASAASILDIYAERGLNGHTAVDPGAR